MRILSNFGGIVNVILNIKNILRIYNYITILKRIWIHPHIHTHTHIYYIVQYIKMKLFFYLRLLKIYIYLHKDLRNF